MSFFGVVQAREGKREANVREKTRARGGTPLAILAHSSCFPSVLHALSKRLPRARPRSSEKRKNITFELRIPTSEPPNLAKWNFMISQTNIFVDPKQL